jgi:hypothetical protein
MSACVPPPGDCRGTSGGSQVGPRRCRCQGVTALVGTKATYSSVSPGGTTSWPAIVCARALTPWEHGNFQAGGVAAHHSVRVTECCHYSSAGAAPRAATEMKALLRKHAHCQSALGVLAPSKWQMLSLTCRCVQCRCVGFDWVALCLLLPWAMQDTTKCDRCSRCHSLLSPAIPSREA